MAMSRRISWGAFVLLAGMNVALGLRIADLRNAEPPVNAGRMLVGLSVPDVRARTSNGETVRFVAGDGGRTLVYVLSAHCRWCDLNEPAIRELASRLPPSTRMVGLVMDKGELAALDDRGLPFPLASFADEEIALTFPAAGTPTTLVVASDGRIEQAWSGAFTKATAAEIGRYFNVEVPAVQSY